jgi:hypothetical protein
MPWPPRSSSPSRRGSRLDLRCKRHYQSGHPWSTGAFQARSAITLMKKNLTVLLTTLGLAGVLSVGLTMARAQSTPSTPPPAGNAPEPHKGAERHPAIHRAIVALEEAKTYLEHADHDFGGHRKQALADCDRAIAQLRLALKYDKK